MAGRWTFRKYGESEKKRRGFEPENTNNRMELTVVIAVLEALKESCHVGVYSDSAYIVKCLQQG